MKKEAPKAGNRVTFIKTKSQIWRVSSLSSSKRYISKMTSRGQHCTTAALGGLVGPAWQLRLRWQVPCIVAGVGVRGSVFESGRSRSPFCLGLFCACCSSTGYRVAAKDAHFHLRSRACSTKNSSFQRGASYAFCFINLCFMSCLLEVSPDLFIHPCWGIPVSWIS